MEEKTSTQIRELLLEKFPDECMLGGNKLVNDLMKAYEKGVTDAAERYRPSDNGFGYIEVYELAVAIFAGIQAMAALVDLIERIWKKHSEGRQLYTKEQVREEMLNALLDEGVSREKAEEYCERWYHI